MGLAPPGHALHTEETGGRHDVIHGGVAQLQLAGVDVVDKLDEAVAAQEAKVDRQKTLQPIVTSLFTDHSLLTCCWDVRAVLVLLLTMSTNLEHLTLNTALCPLTLASSLPT